MESGVNNNEGLYYSFHYPDVDTRWFVAPAEGFNQQIAKHLADHYPTAKTIGIAGPASRTEVERFSRNLSQHNEQTLAYLPYAILPVNGNVDQPPEDTFIPDISDLFIPDPANLPKLEWEYSRKEGILAIGFFWIEGVSYSFYYIDEEFKIGGVLPYEETKKTWCNIEAAKHAAEIHFATFVKQLIHHLFSHER